MILCAETTGFIVPFSSQRRFPDFSYVTQNGRLTDFLDCVIIRLAAVAFAASDTFSEVKRLTASSGPSAVTSTWTTAGRCPT